MSSPPSLFEPVYHQEKDGFGGYAPLSPNDHAFAYDGNSSGKRDHIVWYRAGEGRCSVVRPYESYQFAPIYESEQGIGGWDFGHFYDRAFAFDYDHSGKMDHIVCYRPGSGGVFILRHDGSGNFGPVYAQASADKATEDAGNGIGGYDLRYPWDRMLCFDYDKSGKNDALLLYRRWCARFCVLKNNGGRFDQVYHDWCFGIGGYITSYEGDYAFAFDYSSTGKLDHILFINTVFEHTPFCGVVTRQGEKFVTVWKGDSALMGGFPKTAVYEIIGYTYDFESSGKLDHFGLYWMDHGYVWMMNCPKADGNWKLVYQQNGGGIGNWDAKGAKNDRCIALDFDGSGKMDHLFIYRRTTGAVWILRKTSVTRPAQKLVDAPMKRELPIELAKPTRTTSFAGVMGSNNGVAGFDFANPKDHIFAFDYDHNGRLDHLVFFRPGAGNTLIVKNDGAGSFTAVYSHVDGIGGYNMKDEADRGFAFDYDHSGKLDCMCLYRPAAGIFWILQNKDGQFTPVYSKADGIGGYDLKQPGDRAFAFDYEHTGNRDYICTYRPGAGIIFILKNVKGTFEAVYHELAAGIGGYDMKDPRDRAFAFDYDKSGKMDHIFLYRPGVQVAAVMKNQDGKFTPVYFQSNATNSWGNWRVAIGGYDLNDPADRAFPYDHNGTVKQDHLCFYRPGAGRFTLVQQAMGGFAPLYQGFAGGLGPYAKKPLADTVVFNAYQSDGEGVGTFDVRGSTDHLLPFDFNSTGRCDHIVAYRPGAKIFHVLKRADPAPPPEPVEAPAQQAAAATAWQREGGWQNQQQEVQSNDGPPPGIF